MGKQGIDLNNLDKSNWKTYRFDEIAQNISERVDPNNTDLTVYIGLEHIDSESLHIKRQGTPDDVNGTKLKFYKGDIIFGRRRAYQRKAGIATTDGFCSAHALVLRANPNVIDPELFPFFMHSDLFMHRAVDISVGSLSPTINWGALKHQEFVVPPKDEQAKLAKLLWGVNEVIEKHFSSFKCCELLIKSNEKMLLNKSSYVTKNILDVAEVQRGKFTHRPRNAPQFYGGKIPFIQTSEVVRSDKWIKTYSQTLNDLGLSISKMFNRKTIVMTIAANIGHVGMLDFDSAFTDSLVGIKSFEDYLSQEYLFYYLNHKQKEIENLSTESAQKNLSIERFKSFKIRFPESLNEQRRVVSTLDNLRNNIEIIENNMLASKSLQKSIISQVF